MNFFLLIKKVIIKTILLMAIPTITIGIIYHKKSYILEEIKNPYKSRQNELAAIFNQIKEENDIDKIPVILNKNKNLEIFYYKVEKEKINLISNSIDLNQEITFIDPNYFNDPTKKLQLNLIDQIIPIIFKKLKKSPTIFFHTSIPKGTKLLNFKIKNNILSLNFNENFLNDSFGELGKKIKIAQILKSFSQIKNIQFIEFKIQNHITKYLDRDGLIPNKRFLISNIRGNWNI